MRVHGLVWCGVGFVTGVLCSRLLFDHANVEELHVTPSSNSPLAVRAEAMRLGAEQNSSLPNRNGQSQSKDTGLDDQSQINTNDVTTYSRDETELSFDDLINENQQLNLEIARLKAALTVKQHLPDMAETLAMSLANETRDPQFADDMELQVKDFVYQFGFEQEVELSAVNCKSTVCEISFSSKDAETFDERTWRRVSNKLVEAPWWSTFKATTSTSGNNQMTILATTNWPNEPKRVTQ